MSSVTTPAAAATAAANSSSTSSASGVANTLSASDFLQILVAEFQNQDPTSRPTRLSMRAKWWSSRTWDSLQSINQELAGRTDSTNKPDAGGIRIYQAVRS